MKRLRMGYKGESYMDSGYFLGCDEGLLWIKPAVEGRNKEIVLIPWSEVLPEDEGPCGGMVDTSA